MALRIELFHGDRSILLPLLAEADDSPAQIAGYLGLGEMLVARRHDEIVGQLLLIRSDSACEIKSLAVVETERSRGTGTALIVAAFGRAREVGALRIVVGTAAADLKILGFYQRRGFRMESVERDAFTPANGYPELDVHRIPLRDRVWLSLDLASPSLLLLHDEPCKF